MDFAFQREPAIKAAVLLVSTITLATQVGMASMRRVPPPTPVCQEESMVSIPVLPAESALPQAFAPERIAEYLVEAVVQVESGGHAGKVGDAGERGLMQIKRATWHHTTRRVFGHRVHFDRAFDANLNRKVGRAYLAELSGFLRQHQGSWHADERSLLLACYNAGPARVLEARFDLRRLPASTRDYVERATALHDYYLASDQNRAKELLVVQTPSAGQSDPSS